MENITSMGVFKDMKDHLDWPTLHISVFSITGILLWVIILWLFVDRFKQYNKSYKEELHCVDNNNCTQDEEKAKKEEKTSKRTKLNCCIVILSFHIACGVLTATESVANRRWVPLSFLVIGTATAATFLNASLVATDITNNKTTRQEKEKSVASLVLQCFANGLMLAYLFKLFGTAIKY